VDAVRRSLLEARVRSQWDIIEQVYATVEKRAAALRPDEPALLEGLAYQLHNLYNAVEDLLKVVADVFENSLRDLPRWHTELLERMRLEIEGIRPALLSPELYSLLDELRSFRHFFRHAYGRRLREERVLEVLRRAREAHPLLKRDLEHFLNRLGASLEARNVSWERPATGGPE